MFALNYIIPVFTITSYPDDAQSYKVKYQYLYGDDLLVAPVYLPNQTTWTVYLPRHPSSSHSWVFLWNSTLASPGGASVVVPTLLGQPPVFYRNTSRFVNTFIKMGRMLPIPPPPLPPPSDSATSGSQQPPGGNTAPAVGRTAQGVSVNLIFVCFCVAFATSDLLPPKL